MWQNLLYHQTKADLAKKSVLLVHNPRPKKENLLLYPLSILLIPIFHSLAIYKAILITKYKTSKYITVEPSKQESIRVKLNR